MGASPTAVPITPILTFPRQGGRDKRGWAPAFAGARGWCGGLRNLPISPAATPITLFSYLLSQDGRRGKRRGRVVAAFAGGG